MEITPLIDILFTLIIFFLATATFREQEYEALDLPDKQKGQSSTLPKFIVINVKENGQLSMAGNSLKMAKLESTLRRERKDNPAAKVQIRSHGEAAFKHAAVVLIKCRDAGYLKATIAYDSIE